MAQTVVAAHLEKRVDPIFHPDSYGYRPGKSALDAVGKCRERCWKKDWVIDLDVQKFFDSVRWDLIVKAVEVHTDAPWVVLYVKRWLRAPVQQADGTLLERTRGTPQGASVSPVLANLFLHYAFDMWLVREFPAVEFERYADDAVVHCTTERQARRVLAALQERMDEVGLALHPAKNRDRLLPGREPTPTVRRHAVHVPGVHVQVSHGADEERRHLHIVPARDQQGSLEEDQW
ncbi:reverse transcriptase domain-containing protein [Nocardia gipuzkoensis]